MELVHTPCRHGCGRRAGDGKRGLCWHCHADLAVRRLYPAERMFGRRGVGSLDNPAGRTPEMPTAAPPGSLKKMVEMRRRLRAGEDLFHPGDEDEVSRDLIDPFYGAPVYVPSRDPDPLGEVA